MPVGQKLEELGDETAGVSSAMTDICPTHAKRPAFGAERMEKLGKFD